MKVESKKETKFEPVVITLEKREEFEALFHSMCVNSVETLDKYLEDNDITDASEVGLFTDNLFRKLNNINNEKGYNL